jgi:hypothetical protein
LYLKKDFNNYITFNIDKKLFFMHVNSVKIYFKNLFLLNDKFEKSKKIADSDLINPSIEYLNNIDIFYN